MASAADIRAGRAYVELYVKNRQFLRGLRNARERVRQFGDDLRATGQAVAALGGAALLGFGFVAKIFADFDDAMRAVKARVGATEEEFAALTNKAKELGAATSFTATEVALLMDRLGQAGFDPAQIEAMTDAVLDLARATGTDATLASGYMAASIRQFDLEASDATRVADALTAAANGSFNSVEDLGEALKFAAPVAKDFGMSIEETLAILGALGNIGIQGTMAGTTLRRLLTITGAEAKKLKGIFGDVNFKDAAGNARPLVDVLDEINKSMEGLGSAERSKKLNEAFGLLGITGASAIGRDAGSARDLLEQIEAAGGVAARTAKEMDAGLGGSFRMMMSAIEGVAIAIGDSLSKPLAGLFDLIQSGAAATIEWVKANQEVVVAVAAVAAGVAAAGVAMLALGGAILAVNGALALAASAAGAVGAVFTVLIAPVSAALLGFSALRAVLLTLTAATAAVRAGVVATAAAVFSARTASLAAAAAMGVLRAASLAAAVAVFGLRVAVAALVAYETIVKGMFAVAAAAIVAYRNVVVLARAATITLAGATTALTVAGKALTVATISTAVAVRATRLAVTATIAVQKALVAATGSVRAAFLLWRGAVISVMAAHQALIVVVGAAKTFMVSFRAALIGLRAAFIGVASSATLARIATLAFSAVGAVLTALTSPVALVVAGLAALGYWAYSAVGGFEGLSAMVGGTARAAFGKLGEAVAWFRDTIVPTLVTAFGGIKDAIMSGEWALAGRVALAGLKVAFLQGTAALSGIWGEFMGRFGAQIAGGDFAGAWDTIVLRMAETWAGFAEGMVAVFTQSSRAVIDAWQGAVTSIADFILDLSSAGGAMGAIMSKILGVDMQAEDARKAAMDIKAIALATQELRRAEEDLAKTKAGNGPFKTVAEAETNLKNRRQVLNAARESAGLSATEGAKQTAAADVAAQADAGRAWLGELDRDMQRRTREAQQANRENTEGGNEANQAALEAAQAELDRLREEARRAASESQTLAEQEKQKAKEELDGAAEGARIGGGPGSRTVGSFSAAALAAMGGAKSPEVNAIERVEKVVEEVKKTMFDANVINQNTLQEIRMGGLIA